MGAFTASGEAQLRAFALIRWAQTGKRPANLDGWRLDAQTADAVLEHLGPMALAAQVKALERALRPSATEQAITTGAMTAKDMLNRKLGIPIERVQKLGHVVVEFAGLDPSKRPNAPPEDQSEVVDVAPVDDGDGEE